MREFPVFDGNASSAKPTGQKRLLEYGLRSNNFTVKTIAQNDPQKTAAIKDSVKSYGCCTGCFHKKYPAKEASYFSAQASYRKYSA